jgi:hypothetical protein
MRSSILITLASAVFATAELTPVVKRQAAAVNDTQILQFALTLEHLESVFCAFIFSIFCRVASLAGVKLSSELASLFVSQNHDADLFLTLARQMTKDLLCLTKPLS